MSVDPTKAGCHVESCGAFDGVSVEIPQTETGQGLSETARNFGNQTATISMVSPTTAVAQKSDASPPRRRTTLQKLFTGLVALMLLGCVLHYHYYKQRVEFEVVKFTGEDYKVSAQISDLKTRDAAIENALIEFILTEPDSTKAFSAKRKLYEFRRRELGKCKIDHQSVKMAENGIIHLPLKSSNILGVGAYIRGQATRIEGGDFSSWDDAKMNLDGEHLKLHEGKWHIVLTSEIEFDCRADDQELKGRFSEEKLGIVLTGKENYSDKMINWFYKIKPEQLKLVAGQLLFNPTDIASKTEMSLAVRYKLGDDIDPELYQFDSFNWTYYIRTEEIHRDDAGNWNLVIKPEDLNIANSDVTITLEPDRFYAEGQGYLQPQSFICQQRLETLIRELEANNLEYGRKELPMLIGAMDESELMTNNLLACEALAAFGRAERRAYIRPTSAESVFKKAFYNMFIRQDMAFYGYWSKVCTYQEAEKRFTLGQRKKAHSWLVNIAHRANVPCFVELVHSEEFASWISKPVLRGDEVRDWQYVDAMKKVILEFGPDAITAMVEVLELEIRHRTEQKEYSHNADVIKIILSLFEDQLPDQKWRLLTMAKWSDENPVIRQNSYEPKIELDHVGSDDIAELIIYACRRDPKQVKEQIKELQSDGNTAKVLQNMLTWSRLQPDA